MSRQRSARARIAERIAETICEQGLTNPFGGEVSKQTQPNGRSYYGVSFSHPRTLDGLVRVYGPTFILIDSNQTGQQRCESEAEAVAFIKEHWS